VLQLIYKTLWGVYGMFYLTNFLSFIYSIKFMEISSARKAIQAALNADWDTAISENLGLLAHNPDAFDALMRLSHAYFVTGNVAQAHKYAKKATKIDPSNTLAQKCLAKCSALSSVTSPITHSQIKISIDTFLEEPGKTKTVLLKHLGAAKIIAALMHGQPVALLMTKRQVSVQTEDGTHIGHITDDIAAWIIVNKKHGMTVRGFIKSASDTQVKVFLKLSATSAS